PLAVEARAGVAPVVHRLAIHSRRRRTRHVRTHPAAARAGARVAVDIFLLTIDAYGGRGRRRASAIGARPLSVDARARVAPVVRHGDRRAGVARPLGAPPGSILGARAGVASIV